MVLGQGAVVCIAKNGGMDGDDEALARRLNTWLKTIAATQKRPKERDRDIMWTAFMEYGKQSLNVYADQIAASPPSKLVAAFLEGSEAAAMAQELHDLAVNSTTNRSIDALRVMIPMAYRLRYEPTRDGIPPQSQKAWLSACFLGRLLSAYENFKDIAIDFPETFASLSITWIPGPQPEFRKYKRRELIGRIGVLTRSKIIPPPPNDKIANALGKGGETRCYCHAEVQVLLHLEGTDEAGAVRFKYIGCSKRSCWLCHQLPSRYRDKRNGEKGFYQTRGCHGRVYPFWCIATDPTTRHEYWGMSNYDRFLCRFTMTDQAPEEIHGAYLLYWCGENTLPQNENLESLIGAGPIGSEDIFWNGDVFITRIEEAPVTLEFIFRDVHRSFLDSKDVIGELFRALWKEKAPEVELKRRQEIAAMTEKVRADRELIRGRMSSTERKMLDRHPEILEMLVISSCDDEPVADVSIMEDPNNPQQYRVSRMQRRPAGEMVGWKGFSSSDL